MTEQDARPVPEETHPKPTGEQKTNGRINPNHVLDRIVSDAARVRGARIAGLEGSSHT